MAYAQDFNTEDENNPNKTLTSSSQQAQTLSSTSEPVSAIPSGTGFVNFNRYLNANQDKSAQMGQALAEPFISSIGSQQEKQNQLKSAADQNIANNQIDQNLLQDINKGQFGQSQLQKAQQYSQGLQGARSASDLAGYQDLAKLQADNSQKNAMLGSDAGIKATLAQQYGKNNQYSAGSQTLDTALTNAGEGLNAIRAAQDKYKAVQSPEELTKSLNDKFSGLDAARQNYANTMKQAAAQQVKNIDANYANQLQNLDQYNKQAYNQYDQAVKALLAGSASTLDGQNLLGNRVGADAQNILYAIQQNPELARKVVNAPDIKTLGDMIDNADSYNSMNALLGTNPAYNTQKSSGNNQYSINNSLLEQLNKTPAAGYVQNQYTDLINSKNNPTIYNNVLAQLKAKGLI